MSKNFLREEIRQTSVTIGYSLLKKYSNHAEKKEIVKGLGKGKPFQDCVNELIQTFEKGQDNKMISILIQEALLLSSREYQSLRTMLSYHFDPLEKKLVRNELAPGIYFPKLQTIAQNAQFRSEVAAEQIRVICQNELDRQIFFLPIHECQKLDAHIKMIGATRVLQELLLNEADLYFHHFRYPLEPNKEGIFELTFTRFNDGSSKKNKVFTQNSLSCPTLKRNARHSINTVVMWAIGKDERDHACQQMTGVEEGNVYLLSSFFFSFEKKNLSI